MNKPSNTKSGFTLIEVLVSLGIMVVFLPFAASMLTNSQLLASYSKHKMQAAWTAQQIIETQRQKPLSYFAPLLATSNMVNPQITGSALLDTKGNYTNTDCVTNSANLFCGTATITFSPVIYTNNAGAQTKYVGIYQPPIGGAYPYYSIAHIQVQISWFEQVVGVTVPMNEYYAEDIIVNDSMLN